ncbi:MAG TPA: hypothetical protein EYO91_07485 [Gemmatimonadetes bacterium]|jgi:Ca2+/H+ antiporter|nr:hypothetical protein [Gemmatimonadota bacterium]HIC64057.1 hypothetical protein [Gemmatimonadota bacterium]HIN78472.1 hypothetical protein [Gemmatimonadota bacterium]
MSLIAFHRFLIAAAILFCLGFGLWELLAARDGGGVGALALALIFTLLGIGLIVYLMHLGRFLGYDEGSAPHE